MNNLNMVCGCEQGKGDVGIHTDNNEGLVATTATMTKK